MNVLKTLFSDLENFLALLNDFDYSKLILLMLTILVIYLIHILILTRYHKAKINKTQIELKRINLEANLNVKKRNLLKIYIGAFLFYLFFNYFKKQSHRYHSSIISAYFDFTFFHKRTIK